MRLCFISDCASVEAEATAMQAAVPAILPELITLAQAGHDVSWLTSLSMWVFTDDLSALLSPADEVIPSTCRFVLPCQGYTLAGIRVLDIAAEIWQQAALHTRLFTFLRLFHEAVVCDVWHVWGTLPLVYLVLYTGYLMNIPVVVSVSTAMWHDAAHYPFLWEWVGRHVRHMAVMDTPPSKLSAPPTTFLPLSAQVMAWQIVPPHSQTLAAMYSSIAPVS